jgi:acyl carrier protein
MVRVKVFKIIAEVFLCEETAITDATTAADVEGWDSFNHMNLIMRIEEEFGIAFATDEIGQMGSVGALVSAVVAKNKIK